MTTLTTERNDAILTTERLRLRRLQTDAFSYFAALIRDNTSSQWVACDSQRPVDDASLRGVLTYFSGEESWYCVNPAAERAAVGYVAAAVPTTASNANFASQCAAHTCGAAWLTKPARR